jgi:hypothetical protein
MTGLPDIGLRDLIERMSHLSTNGTTGGGVIGQQLLRGSRRAADCETRDCERDTPTPVKPASLRLRECLGGKPI